MIVDTAIVQPLFTRKGIKQHFNRHEIAHLHRLVEFAIGKRCIVIPVAIDAVVNTKRNSDVTPVHIKRVKFQAVLTHIETEFQTSIFREVVHKRSLQVSEFVIQIQIQEANGITQIENVANVSCTACKHPASWTLMAFCMELGCKSAYLDARFAKPFIYRILTARTTIHLEHRTQAVAILRRESALVELHIVNTFDKERAEKSKEMHRRIDDRIIEQEQILVGSATAHINLGTEIRTGNNARECLDALDDIGFGKSRHALDGLCRNDRFTRLAFGAAAQLHHDFFEFGHFGICVARSKKLFYIDIGCAIGDCRAFGRVYWLLRLCLHFNTTVRN